MKVIVIAGQPVEAIASCRSVMVFLAASTVLTIPVPCIAADLASCCMFGIFGFIARAVTTLGEAASVPTNARARASICFSWMGSLVGD